MKSKQADIIGMVSAGLCVIHCLLLPLLLIVGVASDHFHGLWEHLDWVFIALAWIAVYSATRHEANQRLAQLMWGTVVLFTITLLLHEYRVEALYLSILSSLGLGALHLLHFRKKHTSAEVAV